MGLEEEGNVAGLAALIENRLGRQQLEFEFEFEFGLTSMRNL